MELSKGKCQVLQLGRSIPRHQEKLGASSQGLTGKKLGRRGPGGPGGHQAEHIMSMAMCPCSQEGKWYPGLHCEKH